MTAMPLTADESAVLALSLPKTQTVPLIFASPHSGCDYPPDFVAASRLDSLGLRRSEDSHVDVLFASAPYHGAPLLAARFPRAYCDVNREPLELDPSMFSGPFPHSANTHSPRVAAGLGTIPRVVSSGAEIYAGRLPSTEIDKRLNACYRPYHRCLEELMLATQTRFGWVMLIDCHSMPSIGGPMDHDIGMSRVDMVLGDCHGASCAPAVMRAADETLRSLGYRVVRNAPYAGGYTTRHYGRPRLGRHVLQIELNRSLYMDEATHVRSSGFEPLAADLEKLVAALVSLAQTQAFP